MDVTSNYSSIIFFDTMVALEAKPLAQLPWNELDASGPVLLLAVPQVLKEIDKRKRDGRLAKRARDFNRLITPAACQQGAVVTITDRPVAVDLAVARCKRIDWDSLSDLDPNEPDDKVVAQILNALDVEANQARFLSHDINPIAMATRHGISVVKLPDHWLMPPEPSPQEKEVARLKARVRDLEKNEPSISACIEFDAPSPFTVFNVKPLGESEKFVLQHGLISSNPRAQQPRGLVAINYDTKYAPKYDHFIEEVIPAYIATAHKQIEAMYCQIPFRLVIENTGSVQAENLVINISAQGGTIYNKFVAFPIFGPMAPTPQSPLEEIHSIPSMLNRIPLSEKRGRHDVGFARQPRKGDRAMEWHCDDFRHGRFWEFEGFASIGPDCVSPFALRVSLTASNMHGEPEWLFELPIQAEKCLASKLVDLVGGAYKLPFPLQERFKKSIEVGSLEWCELRD